MTQPRPALIRSAARRVTMLRADVRGASLVEFAIVALPFFAILFAILTTSLTFFAQQSLETVTANLGRTLLTGQTRSNNLTKAQFKALACTRLPAYLRCANLLVAVDRSSDFATAGTSVPTITYASNGALTDTTPYDLGAPGDILTLRLFYVWPLPTVSLGYDISNLPNGKRLLIATSITKVEQYS